MASEQAPNQMPSKLTYEESAVLKECEKESFFKRALPLSLGAMVGIQYLVRTGKLARHPKYGALPKSLIAGGLGYMAGKISYLQECRNKILEKIPDSNLAMQIRKGQSRTQPDMSNRQDMFPKKPPANEADDGIDTGLKYPSDSRSYEGLSDAQRPSVDNEVKAPREETQEQRIPITHEDLRERNRREYNKKLSKPAPPPEPGTPSYKDSPFMPQKTWPDKSSPSTDEQPQQAPPPKRKRTNMWGDVIED